MAEKLHFSLVSPERELFSGLVDQVDAPGVEGDFGTPLGLTKDWAYQAIKGTGNYGEIFERNIGTQSPLKLERGLNALWSAPRPGLLYSPPLV